MAQAPSDKPTARPSAPATRPSEKTSTSDQATAKTPESQRSQAVRALFTPDPAGGGTLRLEYAGALVDYEPIWVRLGERRAGREWLNTRDVRLEKKAAVASAKISLAPGEPVEGAEFAFHAKKGEQELWDNAGRNNGCYLLDARTGAISTR